MAAQKFFTDIFPNQDRKQLVLFNEKDAVTIKKTVGTKRIWIEVDIPDDKQLWPNSFTGEQATVTNIEVEQ